MDLKHPNDGDTSNAPSSAISASHLENRKENVSALAKIQGLFSTAECENGTGTNAEKWLRFFGTLQGKKVRGDKCLPSTRKSTVN